jgi:DNA-binding YbaB/EbfC family protein
MKNLGQMMKQVQDMQTRMADMQAKLDDLEIEGSAGGGAVKATLNGKGNVRAVKLDPGVVNGSDVEMLEDLIVAAVNDAKAKVDAEVQARMSQVTGGLNLPPGLKLPF